MALQATLPIDLSDKPMGLYVRLNNVDVVNLGSAAGVGEVDYCAPPPQAVFARVLFRGFASEGAFSQGRRFLFERSLEFSADLSQSLCPQAYSALRATPEFADAVDA